MMNRGLKLKCVLSPATLRCSQKPRMQKCSSVISMSRGFSQRSSGRPPVDLRSDTVTRPSAAMLRAMAEASVGDDVYKEDPTVNMLEKRCATLFGMEASLFVPSGTMANLIAVMVHCDKRGDFMLIGSKQHLFLHCQGNFAQLAGVSSHSLPNRADGTIPLDELESALAHSGYPDPHCGRYRLISLENTHNACGGVPLDPGYVEQVTELAHRYENVKVHVDGARLLNAAVALHLPPAALLPGVDSVSLCFSKGLGCPVGSILAGSKEFIRRAERCRKALGGGMRQAGVLAAAALMGIDNATAALARDHHLAKSLYEGLINAGVDVNPVKTNILLVNTGALPAETAAQKLENIGVLCCAHGLDCLRLVTHCDIHEEDIPKSVEGFSQILGR